MTALIRKETAQWGAIIKEQNIQVDGCHEFRGAAPLRGWVLATGTATIFFYALGRGGVEMSFPPMRPEGGVHECR